MCVREAQAWVWRQAAGGRGWRGEAAGGGLGEGRLDGAAGLRWYARGRAGGRAAHARKLFFHKFNCFIVGGKFPPGESFPTIKQLNL